VIDLFRHAAVLQLVVQCRPLWSGPKPSIY